MKKIDLASVTSGILNVVIVVVIFMALLYGLDSCSNEAESDWESKCDEYYDEGYRYGYEDGEYKGTEKVINDPRAYDLYTEENILDMLDSLFDDDIPDDAYWYLNH